MSNFNETYLAGVRWPELALAVAVAVLGDLQLHIATGGKIDQTSILKAAGVGAGVAWAYLRMPKEPGATPDTDLPSDADATGPKDDVAHELVVQAVSSKLPPMVAAAAPELAENIADELGRVLRRGIRFKR